MPCCTARAALALVLALLCLGACAPKTTVGQAPATAFAPTSVATATPLPTSPVRAQTPFACPVTVAGSTAMFDDPTIGLRFTFPAAWTERDCVDSGPAVDGERVVRVGNLFSLGVAPRDGLSIQQWVAKLTDPQVEQVTLAPFSVAHAQDAASLDVTSVPNAPRPPTQLRYVVASTEQFYDVTPLIAQMSMSDTIPQPYAQAVQQVVATFDVP